MLKELNKPIAVYGGAGANGKQFAAMLIESGYDVYIIDTNIEALSAIRSQGGITLHNKKEGETKEASINPTRVWSVEEAKSHAANVDFHHVLDVTPAYANNKESAEFLETLGVPVLAMANGLTGFDLDNPYRKTLGDKLVRGVTNFPSKTDSGDPSKVTALSNWSQIKSKGISLASDHHLDGLKFREISELYIGAGIAVNSGKTEQEMSLNKLLSIGMMGVLASLGTTFGDAANIDNITGQVTAKIMAEQHKIAEKIGVDFGQFDELLARQQKVLQGKAASMGSLQMAILNGGKTEKDAIYGRVINLAAEHDISLPYHGKVLEIVTLLEKQAEVYKDAVPLLQNMIREEIAQTEGQGADKILNLDLTKIQVMERRSAFVSIDDQVEFNSSDGRLFIDGAPAAHDKKLEAINFARSSDEMLTIIVQRRNPHNQGGNRFVEEDRQERFGDSGYCVGEYAKGLGGLSPDKEAGDFLVIKTGNSAFELHKDALSADYEEPYPEMDKRSFADVMAEERVTDLVLTGTQLKRCILGTVCDLRKKGYGVTVLDNAVARQLQDNAKQVKDDQVLLKMLEDMQRDFGLEFDQEGKINEVVMKALEDVGVKVMDVAKWKESELLSRKGISQDDTGRAASM